MDVFVWQENPSYYAQALRPSLSEQNSRSLLQELWSVHESEPYQSPVLETHVLFVHLYDFGCLPNDTTVDHGLIVGLDGRWVVQNHHLCLEVVNWLRLGCWVNQDHTLPEIVPFELLLLNHGLYCKTDSLACHSFLNSHSLVMDALHLNWAELPLLIRSQ